MRNTILAFLTSGVACLLASVAIAQPVPCRIPVNVDPPHSGCADCKQVSDGYIECAKDGGYPLDQTCGTTTSNDVVCTTDGSLCEGGTYTKWSGPGCGGNVVAQGNGCPEHWWRIGATNPFPPGCP
jgi:hypothetical protein